MTRRLRPRLIAGAALLAISLAVVGCSGQAGGLTNPGKSGLLRTPFAFLAPQLPPLPTHTSAPATEPARAPAPVEAVAPATQEESVLPATSSARSTDRAQQYAGHHCPYQ